MPGSPTLSCGSLLPGHLDSQQALGRPPTGSEGAWELSTAQVQGVDEGAQVELTSTERTEEAAVSSGSSGYTPAISRAHSAGMEQSSSLDILAQEAQGSPKGCWR